MSSQLIKSLAKDAISAARAEPEPGDDKKDVTLTDHQRELAREYKDIHGRIKKIRAHFASSQLDIDDDGDVTHSYKRSEQLRREHRNDRDERIRKISALRTRALLDILGRNAQQRAKITREFAVAVDKLSRK